MNLSEQIAMNRQIRRNPNKVITEADLDEFRAYVIRSQRPLQAVKLLEKEKEEREADYNFNQQKKMIIEKAQKLEKDKTNFKKEQMKMIERVEKSMDKIIKNATKRKFEEQRKEKEDKDIAIKEKRILEMKEQLRQKKDLLESKKKEMESYKVYSDFLKDVVNEDTENQEFDDIDSLKNRFFNLKKEYNNLVTKQKTIYNSIEKEKKSEKEIMSDLQTQLYSKQKILQQTQKQLENISSQSAQPPAAVDHKESEDRGQIVRAISNLYDISIKHLHTKGRYKKFKYKDITEETPDLTNHLVERMDLVNEVLEDLRETKRRFDAKAQEPET